MKKTLLVALLLMATAVTLKGQRLSVHLKDGTQMHVELAQVDSITFGNNGSTPPPAATVSGTWLWGSAEAGYYELLTLMADHTFAGYDNYFSYGFDVNTYGYYSLQGAMLTLRSYGYGYNRVYRWFVTGLSETALEVMTQMGHFVYYRLQPDVLRLKAGGEPFVAEETDKLLFADGVTARMEGNSLYGLLPGTTYVLLNHGHTDLTMAYKVVVE